MTLQRSAELLLVGGTGCAASGGGAAIPFPADFQLRGPRLTQPLHDQAKRAIFDLRIQHAPHGVSLGRPQVQQAAVVLSGNGVLGLRQVKGHGAVFQHHGAHGLAEKTFHGAG